MDVLFQRTAQFIMQRLPGLLYRLIDSDFYCRCDDRLKFLQKLCGNAFPKHLQNELMIRPMPTF